MALEAQGFILALQGSGGTHAGTIVGEQRGEKFHEPAKRFRPFGSFKISSESTKSALHFT